MNMAERLVRHTLFNPYTSFVSCALSLLVQQSPDNRYGDRVFQEVCRCFVRAVRPHEALAFVHHFSEIRVNASIYHDATRKLRVVVVQGYTHPA